MGAVYGTAADIRAVGYPLSAAQETSASVLLEQASAKLRTAARKTGMDIDAMIADPVTGEDYALTVKSVVVQAVIRALDSVSGGQSSASAITQAGLGYSATMTCFNPGQSLYFLRSELKDLGLARQTFGALEVYRDAADPGD